MGNTRVINWGNTPLLLDLQTRCNAPGRSYTWTACDMRSTHVPLRTHSSALCNTGQHPRGRGPPPETRSRLWPMVFGLWLVIIVWCHFMVGGARAEIQYISSAPSVLTPIRLLTTPTTSHEVYAYPGLSRDFVVLGLHRVLKGAKSSTARMSRFQMRFYVRCDDSISGVTSGTKFYRILSKH